MSVSGVAGGVPCACTSSAGARTSIAIVKTAVARKRVYVRTGCRRSRGSDVVVEIASEIGVVVQFEIVVAAHRVLADGRELIVALHAGGCGGRAARANG